MDAHFSAWIGLRASTNKYQSIRKWVQVLLLTPVLLVVCTSPHHCLASGCSNITMPSTTNRGLMGWHTTQIMDGEVVLCDYQHLGYKSLVDFSVCRKSPCEVQYVWREIADQRKRSPQRIHGIARYSPTIITYWSGTSEYVLSGWVWTLEQLWVDVVSWVSFVTQVKVYVFLCCWVHQFSVIVAGSYWIQHDVLRKRRLLFPKADSCGVSCGLSVMISTRFSVNDLVNSYAILEWHVSLGRVIMLLIASPSNVCGAHIPCAFSSVKPCLSEVPGI